MILQCLFGKDKIESKRINYIIMRMFVWVKRWEERKHNHIVYIIGKNVTLTMDKTLDKSL